MHSISIKMISCTTFVKSFKHKLHFFSLSRSFFPSMRYRKGELIANRWKSNYLCCSLIWVKRVTSLPTRFSTFGIDLWYALTLNYSFGEHNCWQERKHFNLWSSASLRLQKKFFITSVRRNFADVCFHARRQCWFIENI